MKIEPAVQLVGHVAVPGDKSISHRSVLLGALGEGETHVHRFGRSGDTQSTIDAVRALGVEVEDVAEDELVVHGVGLRGLRAGHGRLRQRRHADASAHGRARRARAAASS